MLSQKMRITILGCGTSTGVPLIHCSCEACTSKNPKNNRLRASLWVEVQGKSLVVDVSPDFRQQALRAQIPRLDGILFTHPHADHIGGVDEIRSFNFIQKEEIPAWGHDWTIRDLTQRFPYIFTPTVIEGGGVAKIRLHEFKLNDPCIDVLGVSVIPVSLDHGSQKVAGFRIHNFAYITDCHSIPDNSMERLENLEILILDCLRLARHDTHLNFEQALEYAEKIAAKRTIFTHLSHDFEFESTTRKLPKNCELAYDGLHLELQIKN